MSTKYKKGTRYEYKCVEKLKEDKETIFSQRSAGSHSIIDIWNYRKDGSIIVIQVKSGTANTRVEEFRKLPCASPNRKQLWYYHDRTLEVEDIQ